MADYKDKWEDNNPNPVNISNKSIKFYCDKACISCSVCRENAPNNFKLSELGNHSICFKQPENQQELDECEEALICCPVMAIGKIENDNLEKESFTNKKNNQDQTSFQNLK